MRVECEDSTIHTQRLQLGSRIVSSLATKPIDIYVSILVYIRSVLVLAACLSMRLKQWWC